MVLNLASAVASEALAAMPHAEYNPAWSSDGLTVASVIGAGSVALSVDANGEATTVTGNRGAIDLPLSWSPDGETLAARTIEGANPLEAGTSRLELIDTEGGRAEISSGPDVAIVGWLE
jgi:hypothetical protein